MSSTKKKLPKYFYNAIELKMTSKQKIENIIKLMISKLRSADLVNPTIRISSANNE